MSNVVWLKYDLKSDGVIEVDKKDNCIGFLDSGMGGMSIVEYLARRFPEETFMFLKDSDNFPYGPKSKEQLIKIGHDCIEKLLSYNPPVICVACNTMCCALANEKFKVPILKINEEIVKQVKETLPLGKKIYVICTKATKDSHFYQLALKGYNVEVHSTPEFVIMVEKHHIDKEKVARKILKKTFDADGIILGCTHFNYLHNICHELLGDKVYIFDGLENLKKHIVETSLPNDNID